MITIKSKKQYGGYSSYIECRKNISISKNMYVLVIFLLMNIFYYDGVSGAAHSVLKYEQLSPLLSQLVTSSTLEWESYKPTSEIKPKQLEFAILGGTYTSEDEHYPIYICRANLQGVYRNGYTEKRANQKHVCIIPSLSEDKTQKSFDVLVNKGKLGKVAWKKWKKFDGAPNGAISVNQYTFVARRQASQHTSDGESSQGNGGADYYIGRLDKSISYGKIVVQDHSGEESQNQDGEVLVEVDPIRYELTDIVLDKIRMDVKINTTDLASTVLSNTDETAGPVKSLITYDYDLSQNWGNHEGLARGLPTRIYEQGTASKPSEIRWALKSAEKKSETKEISSYLYPGTAINVTLKANVTTIEAPYSAKLMTFYQDYEKISTKISSMVHKVVLSGVKLEFSPVYWIENGTLIPTTTTTSTTTTESTKHVTKEAHPISSPPTVTMTDVSTSPKSVGSSSISSNEVYSSDELEAHKRKNSENYAENLQDHSSPPSTASHVVLSSSLVGLICAIIVSTYYC